MRFLHILWTIFWNLITISIYAAMFSVANTDFETVVIAGLRLIYVTIITYSTSIVRTLTSHSRSSVMRFARLGKIVGNVDEFRELQQLEDDTQADWEDFEKRNVHFYINSGFLVLIWFGSVFAILVALA